MCKQEQQQQQQQQLCFQLNHSVKNKVDNSGFCADNGSNGVTMLTQFWDIISLIMFVLNKDTFLLKSNMPMVGILKLAFSDFFATRKMFHLVSTVHTLS